ncbi:unnamed protein product [Vitrella brassicaformis CCMP3155]|uniref:Wntless-like transmembrane domain-containing protein n=1 Tax=Vitrella brassicaformis (strain CCMP3155) TaxID=1169540 RepID=A0A0G4FUC9_VITBC|nr:unnamed protein product [Vitrella brassicaformis CCMP3155]|mmetsp:Transcript_6346/g.15306  ORF Transcript_6346/g.15306 Transcript_6346/m.15306 type:complete len:697 (-) Transcript_6346:241-2331(-)|eukprot:CEM18526.1 unnamed protein product [Vitrella brassicaformis CCMP3155]
MEGILDRQFAIKLDTLTKRDIGSILCAWITVYASVLLLALFGPSVMETHTYSAWQCGAHKAKEFDPDKCQGVDLTRPESVWFLNLHFTHKYDHLFYLTARLTDKHHHRRRRRARQLLLLPDPNPAPFTKSSSNATADGDHADADNGVVDALPSAVRRRTRLFPSINSESLPSLVESVSHISCAKENVHCHKIGYVCKLGLIRPKPRRIPPPATTRAGPHKTRRRRRRSRGRRALDTPDHHHLWRRRGRRRRMAPPADSDEQNNSNDTDTDNDIGQGLPPLEAPVPSDPLKEGGSNATEGPPLEPYHLIGQKVERVVCFDHKQLCEPIVVLNTHQSEYSSFNITFRLVNTTQELDWVGDVVFDLVLKNGYFAVYEAVCKVIFLCITGLALLVFLLQMNELPVVHWNVEQRWVVFLLFCLMGFNDPTFILVFVLESQLFMRIGIFLRVTFFCALLVFWLVVLEGIASEAKPRGRMCLKLCFAANIWVASSVYFLYTAWQETNHPFHLFREDIVALWPFQLWLLLSGGVYVIWLLFLAIRAFTEIKLLQYRFKLLYFLHLVNIIALFIAALTGSAGPVPRTTFQFMAVQALLNFYLYALAAFYVPAIDATAGHHREVEEEAREIMRDLYGDEDEYDEEEMEEETDPKLKAAMRQIEMSGDSDEEEEEFNAAHDHHTTTTRKYNQNGGDASNGRRADGLY